jgi:large subunit ribosomal protein L30
MIAAVRVRGGIDMRKDIEDTLQMLGLRHVNNCVLLPETSPMKGMLQKSKDYVTWGEADLEVIEKLIGKRGVSQGKSISDILKKSKFKTLDAFVKGVTEGSTKLAELGIKKTFRLSPPSKGYERGGVKKPYSTGGALGYRGKDINSLLVRMI